MSEDTKKSTTMYTQKWKKRILVVIGITVAIFVIIFAAGFFILQSISIPALLVKQIESTLRVRADIKDFSVKVFPRIGIRLNDFALYPRDTVADNAIPLIERKPPTRQAVISIPKIDLSLELLPLLTKKTLTVSRFILNKPEIHISFLKSGGLNIFALLASPKIVNGKINPTIEAKTTKSTSAPFDVRELPIAGSLNEVGIRDAKIDFVLVQNELTLLMQPMNLILTDIEIDPKNLQEKNQANLQFDFRLFLLLKNNQQGTEIAITSKANIVPFSADNGQINPDILYKLTIQKDSRINGLRIMDRLAEVLKQMEAIGFNSDFVEPLRKEFRISQDSNLSLNYYRGRIKLVENTYLFSPNINLSLIKNSSLSLNSLNMRLQGHFEIGSTNEQSIFTAIDNSLADLGKISLEEARVIRSKHFANITTTNNNKEGLSLKYIATGPISSPNVKFLSTLPNVEKILQEVLQSKINQQLEQQKKQIQEQQKQAQEQLQKQVQEQQKQAQDQLQKQAQDQLQKQLESLQ